MVDIASIGVLTALIAGIVSFLSPCVLPLVPGYLAYVAGQSLDSLRAEQDARARTRVLTLSTCFVLGFSTVFIALGASATVLGQLLLGYRREAGIIGGAIVMLFGLFMLGLVRIAWFQRDLRIHTELQGGRPVSAYALGLAFGFGWTPCIGPVLGAILALSAATATLADGILLLGTYSLGLGVPFLVSALFTKGLLQRVKTMHRVGRPLQTVAGGVLIGVGFAMATGQLSAFSYWLLDSFPALGRIG